MAQKFGNFTEFYRFYLSEHQNGYSRILHFCGTLLVLILVTALLTGIAPFWTLLVLPLVGYAPAWIGHFVFEKNRPATFRHPLYSLMADFVMFYQLATGRIDFFDKSA